MEDVVAVRLVLENRKECFFMTWGRIQHPTDPTELQSIVLQASPGFGVGGNPSSAELCASLREASGAPFFYEGLIHFSQRTIPYGDGYKSWKEDIGKRMKDGKELYFLGAE
jgi:hypothetical protein